MAQRAWLDIGIGDAEQDQQEQAAWTASCAFLRAVHMQVQAVKVLQREASSLL